MKHFPLADPAAATGRTKAILDAIAARRGRVPNMIRALAHSPAALAAYSGFGTSLSGGVLPEALRERIAIAVAAANDCSTCLAAHTHFGRAAGLSDAELAAAREGHSADPVAQAALRFALAALHDVGHVPDEAHDALRAAGFGEAAMMEILATVFINVFSNAVNHLAGTKPDDWTSSAGPVADA